VLPQHVLPLYFGSSLMPNALFSDLFSYFTTTIPLHLNFLFSSKSQYIKTQSSLRANQGIEINILTYLTHIIKATKLFLIVKGHICEVIFHLCSSLPAVIWRDTLITGV
jgi:hypothetical protein